MKTFLKPSKLILFLVIVTVRFNTFASVILASSFGFNSTNTTLALKNAIESLNDTVIVDLQADDWNIEPMVFFDLQNKTIIFEKGAKLKALSGEFNDFYACLLKLVRCHDINLIGYGAEFVMNKSEYIAINDGSEFRHCLQVENGVNIQVLGFVFRDSGGDGIFISGANYWAETRTYSENILIQDVQCINNYRQGMSICSVQDMFVKNCSFTKTAGILPEAGVDVEPFEAYQRIVNLNFKECSFTENNWSGLALALVYMDSTSLDVSISVVDCLFSNNCYENHPYGTSEIFVSANDSTPVGGSVLFNRCAVDSSLWTAFYSRKVASAYDLTFKDCVFKDVSLNQNKPYNSPIFLEVNDYANPSPTIGGIHFENLFLSYPTNFPFFHIYGWSTLEGVEDVTGTFTLVEPNDTTWLFENFTDTLNFNLHYTSQTSLPLTSVYFNKIDSVAIECIQQAAVWQTSRLSNKIDYPLLVRSKTAGTVVYADDVHLKTGALIIETNSISKNDSLVPREDKFTEPLEDAILKPLQSQFYQTTLDSLLFLVSDCSLLSVNENENTLNQMLVYPNPIVDEFFISNFKNWKQIVIYSFEGKEIRSFNKNDSLSVQGLSKGIYLLQILDTLPLKTETFKIIID